MSDPEIAAIGASKKMADELGMAWVDSIDPETIDYDILAKTPYPFARDNLIMPLSVTDNRLRLVTARPLDVTAQGDLRLMYGMPLTVMVAESETVKTAINSAYDTSAHTASDVMDDLEETPDDLDELVHGLPEDLLETSAEAPVIRLVNSILMQAAKEKASDIHIEPYERELVVRFRIDGALRNIVKPPKSLQPLLVSRVKIMAGLDIAEKRLPQDGRLKIVIAGKEIDIRISSIPTSHGERLVLRLLDKEALLLQFDQIGMTRAMQEQVSGLLAAPHGVILVSGPTGSGKTTTLYTALSSIHSTDKNILTVEDPVEYQIPGIGQMQVNSKINLTFASGLRSILRQDPDVIMVGEIRDSETAQIAVQASLTGHLVFSTIHTNDAAGAVTRLTDMGVEPFLISSSLLAVMAQRLVRILCPNCKEDYRPDGELLDRLGVTPSMATKNFYRPRGCSACFDTGYKGRTGIYELLVVTDELRNLIVKNADATTLRKAAEASGFRPMRLEGIDALTNGLTSVEELLRVTADVE